MSEDIRVGVYICHCGSNIAGTVEVLDVARIGLSGGRRVRVASRRGEIELYVRMTERIRRGIVVIPFHFAEAAAESPTNGAIDPVAKIPEYKLCAVTIKPVGA